MIPAPPGGDATDVVVIGAGSLGGLLLDCLHHDERWRCTAFHDDAGRGGTMRGLPVLGTGPEELRPGTRAMMAIGDPVARRAAAERLAGRGLDWQTFVDRRSMVGPHARLGRGSLVLPFAMIGSDAVLGRFAVLSAYGRVGDGSRVGDYVSMLAGCSVGDSSIGDECLLGLGSTCLSGADLSERVTVAPMTLVRRPVPAGALVAGQPARVFRRQAARASISATPAPEG